MTYPRCLNETVSLLFRCSELFNFKKTVSNTAELNKMRHQCRIMYTFIITVYFYLQTKSSKLISRFRNVTCLSPEINFNILYHEVICIQQSLKLFAEQFLTLFCQFVDVCEPSLSLDLPFSPPFYLKFSSKLRKQRESKRSVGFVVFVFPIFIGWLI